MVYYSCYFSPNRDAEEYEKFLLDLTVSIRTQGKMVMVAGDFNSKAVEWGNQVGNHRGRMMRDWAAAC